MTDRLHPIFGKFFLFLLSALVLLPQGYCKDERLEPAAQTFRNEVHKALIADAWTKCIDVCSVYLSKHENDLLARAIRGYALMECNRESQSLADLSAAIYGGLGELPCDLVEAHTNNMRSLRGYAEMKVGRFREGIADIEKSLKSPRLLVSDYLIEAGDYQNLAIAYLKLLERLAPSSEVLRPSDCAGADVL